MQVSQIKTDSTFVFSCLLSTPPLEYAFAFYCLLHMLLGSCTINAVMKRCFRHMTLCFRSMVELQSLALHHKLYQKLPGMKGMFWKLFIGETLVEENCIVVNGKHLDMSEDSESRTFSKLTAPLAEIVSAARWNHVCSHVHSICQSCSPFTEASWLCWSLGQIRMGGVLVRLPFAPLVASLERRNEDRHHQLPLSCTQRVFVSQLFSTTNTSTSHCKVHRGCYLSCPWPYA